MKRIFVFLMMLLLLAGCEVQETAQTDPDSTISTTVQQETEPPVSWLKEQGMPWDKDGALVEIPLSVPGGSHYTNFAELDGDLLLWSLDEHLADRFFLELCLIELDDGSVAAQRDIEVGGYVTAQPLQDSLYICDNNSGLVLKLDKSLQIVCQWQLEKNENSWYFGSDHLVYQVIDGERLWVYDLSVGQFEPVFPEDPKIQILWQYGDGLSLEYYHPDTGAVRYVTLDLTTGTLVQPDAGTTYGSLYISGDSWLSEKSVSPFKYRFSGKGAEPVQVIAEEGSLRLVDEDRILLTSGDGQYLYLYDFTGKPISSCRISEAGWYSVTDIIWNEKQGGYFLPVSMFESSSRLLFWDISHPPKANDLVFEPIPKPSEKEAALLQRCEELGEKYGLSILIGEDCDTDFFDFTAAHATDWDEVEIELDLLEDVLSDYPEDFFRQLRYDSVQITQIQLVTDLTPHEGSSYTGTYLAFVQDEWSRSLMVVDIFMSDKSTYYHEFSHIIDSFLEWDSNQREDALFSEETWQSYNPDWFEGYTFDYSQERDLKNDQFFVDTYSTINPTEDRARVMEYGMVDYGGWTFENGKGLMDKLDYYCRCIRDAFDTTGWEETVLWEQYLKQ